MARIGKRKKWKVTRCDDMEAAGRIQIELGVSELASRLLVNRNIRTPEEADRFLGPSYDHLSDPLLLPDAGNAVERLKQALHQKELIYIHGDYDVDGVTSAALWTRLLTKLGGNVMVRVPHRKRDGYDLQSKFVTEAKAAGAGLILTTDCGIQQCEEVEEARAVGVDVIITDHHKPGDQIPRAVAVVNPHLADSLYPFSDLSGVGVAFRLGEALCRSLDVSVSGYRDAYADLAAIGTVADMVPLIGDNRVIVKYGLEALAKTKKPGLQALMRSSGIVNRNIDADSIGYRMAPRLNAIGRMDESKIALDLLLTKDANEADALAERMECANNERRLEVDRIFGEAMEMLAKGDFSDSHCLVLDGENWTPGVIGIVAGRVCERTGRPTIILCRDAETGRIGGSARSIRSFNIKEALDSCAQHLIEYGGHAQAAGMQVVPDKLEAFAQAMNEIAREQLTESDLEPCYEVEVEMDPTQVTNKFMDELRRFEPWGMGNKRPLFVSRNIRIADVRRMGKESQHLKLRCEFDGSFVPDAVYWNVGDLADHLHVGDPVDICYKPQLNTWNDRTTVQFLLEDLHLSDADDW